MRLVESDDIFVQLPLQYHGEDASQVEVESPLLNRFGEEALRVRVNVEEEEHERDPEEPLRVVVLVVLFSAPECRRSGLD